MKMGKYLQGTSQKSISGQVQPLTNNTDEFYPGSSAEKCSEKNSQRK